MQVTVERAALLAALSQAASVTARKSTIPALTHTILTAADGRLEIYATDLDRGLELTVAATTDRAGVAMPSTLALRDTASRLPEGARLDMTLDPGSDRLRVRSGGSRFVLPCLDPRDLPRLAAPSPAAGQVWEMTLPAPVLWRLVGFAEPFMSDDDKRHYLQGVFLHLVDGKLRGVGTNGSMLAYASMPAPEDLGSEWKGFILPAVTVPLVVKLADAAGDTGTVHLTGNETRVRMAFHPPGDMPGPVLTTKLVDGTFPEYQYAVPRAEPQARIGFDRPALVAAVGRVTPFSAQPGGASPTLLIDATAEMNARLAARSASGEAEDSVALGHQSGRAAACFNPKYVAQACAAFNGSQIDMALMGPIQPMIVTDPYMPDSLILIAGLNVRPDQFAAGST